MFIQEQHVNETLDCLVGESGLYEPFTENIGKLFKAYQREYGMCTGKVYVDDDGGNCPVGWVFRKKQKYSDTNEEYTHAVWVTLHKKESTVVTTYHYNFLKEV